MDKVHVSMDRLGVLGPLWTDAGADRGHGGALTGAWPPAAPVRQSTPAGVQNREGSEGNSARAALWRPGDGGAERGDGGAR
jgi:hypothetical protein